MLHGLSSSCGEWMIASLCDLTSGSGDKGTPIVLVQGYFDNYTN